MNDNKYPVKYGVLLIKEKGGWVNNYEDIEICYIVSKCYVIEESIKYYMDGSSKHINKVFFPFNSYDDIKSRTKYIEPAKLHIDYYGYPLDMSIIDNLFDTFEEAKEDSNEKNEFLRQMLSLKIPLYKNPNYITQYNELLKIFDSNLQMCTEYEKLIQEMTRDLAVTVDKTEKIKRK